MPHQVPSLTLSDAREIIAAGEQRAQDLGIPYNIAVVDAGGDLTDQEQKVVEAAVSGLQGERGRHGERATQA